MDHTNTQDDSVITTTLNRIRAYSPCTEGWTKLLAGLGKTAADDEPLPFADIVRINGLDDALWYCRAEPEHDRTWRLFAVWCCRQVQSHMPDPRSLAALDVAEQHGKEEATDEELDAAGDAAWAAAKAATGTGAGAAAGAAAWAAARAAAGDAAWTAAIAAAGAAAWAAARDAAWAATWAAARDAARERQTEEFLRVVTGETEL
jgi:hypothetical protein